MCDSSFNLLIVATANCNSRQIADRGAGGTSDSKQRNYSSVTIVAAVATTVIVIVFAVAGVCLVRRRRKIRRQRSVAKLSESYPQPKKMKLQPD